MAMPNLIIDLSVDRVDLVDEGANSASHIMMYKRKETDQVLEFEQILEKMKPEHVDIIRQEVSKAKETVTTELSKANEVTVTELAKAKEEVKTLKEEADKKATTEEDLTEEEVMKSLDPSVQAIFKSMKAQKEAAEQVAREASEKATNDEAISKAKDLKALPVEEAKLVEILKGISPEIHEILKAANQAIEDGGAFEEIGKGKNEAVSTNASEAWDKIEKAADKISAEESVTKAKAITMAVKANPDLYREYLKGGAN